ncbi:MAG TPA: signal peptidase II [bacterium]|nr:signal peptidase II [bacterium]HPP86376.1 signal peptidase II [bacterium]
MKKIYWLISGLILLVLDAISKLYIHKNFELGESKNILGEFFKITYIRNTGIAFGMFQEFGEIFSYIIPLAIIILLFIFYKTENKNLLIKLAFLGIITGAFGNFIDRIFYGYVVDFIDIDFFNISIAPFKILGIEFSGYYLDRWPAFNLADSLISCGVVLLCIDTMLDFKDSEEKDTDAKSKEDKNVSDNI